MSLSATHHTALWTRVAELVRPTRILDIGAAAPGWLTELQLTAGGDPLRATLEVTALVDSPTPLSELQRGLYQDVRSGTLIESVEQLHGGWDLACISCPLNQLSKATVLQLVERLLQRCTYVVLNMPIEPAHPTRPAVTARVGTTGADGRAVRNGESQANTSTRTNGAGTALADDQSAAGGQAKRAARSQSFWAPHELFAFPVIGRQIVQDGDTAIVSAVLAIDDPRGIESRFAADVPIDTTVDPSSLPDDFRDLSEALLTRGAQGNQIAQLAERIKNLEQERRYARSHASTRLAQRLRNSSLWNSLRWLRNRNQRVVTLRALGSHHPRARGSEVWLLGTQPNSGDPSVPWDFLERDPSWQLRPEPASPYGECLFSNKGRVRIPVDEDPELRFLSHPWSGRVEINFRGRTEIIDLFGEQPTDILVHPGRSSMVTVKGASRSAIALDARPELDAADRAAAERLQNQKPQVIAVHCPRWLGVTNSTRALFRTTYPIPELPAIEPYDYPRERLVHHAEILLASGCKHFVFSGGDEVHFDLMEQLHRRDPSVRLDMLWHSNYLQLKEPYIWRILQRWVTAAKNGAVRRIGVVKKGMDQFFNACGVDSAFVMNYLPAEPQALPELPETPRRIGMWFSGTTHIKLPFAMLSALKLIPDCELHGAGLDERAREVVDFFGVPRGEVHPVPLPRSQLDAAIRRTHLTMYVTFAECCPMLPLESLHLGVPCLLGATSHLFQDEPFLFERLVVPFGDRAEVIAEYADRAIRERGEIIEAYQRYIPQYAERARASVQAFLA